MPEFHGLVLVARCHYNYILVGIKQKNNVEHDRIFKLMAIAKIDQMQEYLLCSYGYLCQVISVEGWSDSFLFLLFTDCQTEWELVFKS